MRIVFMGTPQIAANCLNSLLRQKHDIVAVYTRADKPVGRKQTISPPPVKVLATSAGIPVLQPLNLRGPNTAETLMQFKPDLVVVVAYGLILPPELLALPKYGCINLHVSLLPKYRGAAPIQWALINGDATTGVSIMQMDAGLDTGPILAQEKISIQTNTTAEQLFETSAQVGANLLASSIKNIALGQTLPSPQQGTPTFAPMLEKTMAELCFTRHAQQLHNLARGCTPWPLAWFMHLGKRIKVQSTQLAPPCSGVPGEIICTAPLTVACGQGALQLLQVVPEGAKSMAGQQWAAGRRFKVGNIIN